MAASRNLRAQALEVVPVNLQLNPGQRAAALTVMNRGDIETTVQMRAFLWSQKNGKDDLTPTDDVVLSPPILTLAPGGKQVIRLVLRRAPEGTESSYRVLLDQIPPPSMGGVVHVVLRLSLPLFAEPTSAVTQHVQFRLERDEGKLWLVGVNHGRRHEKYRDVALTAEEGSVTNTLGSSLYLLAGATRRWPIEAASATSVTTGPLRLKAISDAGPVDQKFLPPAP